MRTVTFSDADVIERLSNGFVCVWENRAPGFHECLKWSDADLRSAMKTLGLDSDESAVPQGILVTFLMTPDLQVLHYVAGFWVPKSYLKQIDFAAAAWKAAKEPDAGDRIRLLHSERRAGLGDLPTLIEIEAAGWCGTYGEHVKHAIDGARKHHLARVHGGFAEGKPGAAGGHSADWDELGPIVADERRVVADLPLLSELRKTYFADEGF